MSHPVALSQCDGFLAAHPEIEVVPSMTRRSVSI